MVRKKKRKQQKKIFRLLDLPAELRIAICQHVFTAPAPVVIRLCVDWDEDTGRETGQRQLQGDIVIREVPEVEIAIHEPCLKEGGATELLRVCKKVYEEARPCL